MNSLLENFIARRADDRPGCTYLGRTTTWSRVVSESSLRAEILQNFLDRSRPARFAILIEDTCEYMFWLGAALLSGASMTGLDPVRDRPVNQHALWSSECQLVVSDEAGRGYLASLDVQPTRTVDLTSGHFLTFLDESSRTFLTRSNPTQGRLFCSLIISSPIQGTKVLDVTDEQVAYAANQVVRSTEMTSHDICYDALPLSCAHSVLSCWGPAVSTGAEIVFQRTFSPSQFLSDVREFNCTYFVFKRSMIDELLRLPTSEFDRDHRLRVGFGTDATPLQMQQFHTRFGCELVDANKWRPKSV